MYTLVSGDAEGNVEPVSASAAIGSQSRLVSSMLLGALLFCVAVIAVLTALLLRRSESSSTPAPAPPPLPAVTARLTPQVLYVLGGQIVGTDPSPTSTRQAGHTAATRGTDRRVVPAFHTQSRVDAAAMIYQRTVVSTPRALTTTITGSDAAPGCDIIMSGGYNVGVRYELVNNTVFSDANFSFAAFAAAPTAGPSEAAVMKDALCSTFDVPRDRVLLEEVSATTDENALFGCQILARYGLLNATWVKPGPLRIGIVTNLFHMQRALLSFRKGFQHCTVPVVFVPIFAEDWCALSDTRDWVSAMESYYATAKGGVRWNATAIGTIMRARRTGATVSVGSLIGY